MEPMQKITRLGSGCLIPYNLWNKKTKGVPRGKTPRDLNWDSKKYNEADVIAEFNSGNCNIGYRLGERDLVIDIDPRNAKKSILMEVLHLLGQYNTLDELLEWNPIPVVKTGGGGWHIYCKLPEGIKPNQIRKCLKDIPGVDFKKLGGAVNAPGGRHPNGNYYEMMESDFTEFFDLTDTKLIKLITREVNHKKENHTGYGNLNNNQLFENVLSKLNPIDFRNHDEWLELMMACHHATGGDGIDSWLEFCAKDQEYNTPEHQHTTRLRWESLHDDDDNSITMGTIHHILNSKGVDTGGLKAVADFNEITNRISYNQDDEDTEENIMATIAHEISEATDGNEAPLEYQNADNPPLKYAQDLGDNEWTIENKSIFCRMLRTVDALQKVDAIEFVMDKKVMSQSAINSRLKAIETKSIDSLPMKLANALMKHKFNDGRNIINEPSDQMWAYNGKFWEPISQTYLEKLALKLLDELKLKDNSFEGDEVNICGKVANLVQIQSSVKKSVMFTTTDFKPIINCQNGELHVNQNGQLKLLPHSPESRLKSILDTNYDPKAKCPKFLKMVGDIFANLPDTVDMINHLGELFGYTIQPYKPIALWCMFYGKGGDGKSTILKILQHMLGDAYYPATQNLLTMGSSNGNNHESASLVGKLALGVEELSFNLSLPDAGLKLLSQNTSMTANPKRKDAYSFSYIGTLFMCCNSYPKIKDVVGRYQKTCEHSTVQPPVCKRGDGKHPHFG